MVKKVLFPLVALAAMGVGVWAFQVNQHDFVTLEGDKYRWKELQGKWVVVNYFAEWCAPCLKEIPELNKFAAFAKQKNNLALFGVSFDALAPAEMIEIQKKYQIEFDLIDSREPKMLNARPQNLPATYIISPQGEVIKRLLGEQSNESLQQMIGALEVL